MIRLETTVRVNAIDTQIAEVTLTWDELEPYAIKMSIRHDGKETRGWLIGRDELRQAIFGNWPVGIMDIIIIKFGTYVRVYLKNSKQKCSLDFDYVELEHFLRKTYAKVSIENEQQHIRDEIDRWKLT